MERPGASGTPETDPSAEARARRFYELWLDPTIVGIAGDDSHYHALLVTEYYMNEELDAAYAEGEVTEEHPAWIGFEAARHAREEYEDSLPISTDESDN